MAEDAAPAETPIATPAADALPSLVDPTPAADPAATDKPTEGAKPAEGDQGEPKPAEGDKPADGEGDKPEGDKPAGAPETYADFSAPEGVVLQGDVFDQFKTVAKELNLPQEAAQRMFDLGIKIVESNQAQTQELVKTAQREWGQQVVNDPELGGEKLTENIAIARKGMNAYGSEELTKLLGETGLAAHPAVIRYFYKVGQTVTEDTVLSGGGEGSRERGDPAERMYPSMKPKT